MGINDESRIFEQGRWVASCLPPEPPLGSGKEPALGLWAALCEGQRDRAGQGFGGWQCGQRAVALSEALQDGLA